MSIASILETVKQAADAVSAASTATATSLSGATPAPVSAAPAPATDTSVNIADVAKWGGIALAVVFIGFLGFRLLKK